MELEEDLKGRNIGIILLQAEGQILSLSKGGRDWKRRSVPKGRKGPNRGNGSNQAQIVFFLELVLTRQTREENLWVEMENAPSQTNQSK